MKQKKTISKKYNWSKKDNDITVETTRKLAAKHGKDGLIIISWTIHDGKMYYQTTTVGKNREQADFASDLRDTFMKELWGADPINMIEDRRSEHTD